MFGVSLFGTADPRGAAYGGSRRTELPLSRGTSSVDFCPGTQWVQRRHTNLSLGSAL